MWKRRMGMPRVRRMRIRWSRACLPTIILSSANTNELMTFILRRPAFCLTALFTIGDGEAQGEAWSQTIVRFPIIY